MKNLFQKIKKLFDSLFKPTYTCTMCGKTYPKPAFYKSVAKIKYCGYYDEGVYKDVTEVCEACFDKIGR